MTVCPLISIDDLEPICNFVCSETFGSALRRRTTILLVWAAVVPLAIDKTPRDSPRAVIGRPKRV